MTVELINQPDRIEVCENRPHEEALNGLLFNMCGGRRIYDPDLFVKALSVRMYWWFPVLSEIQEGQSIL